MKLQTRTNLNYIFVSAVIYVIVALGFYFAVERVMDEEVDRRLLVEKADFERYVDRVGYWESNSYFVEDKIDAREISKPCPIVFKDTLLSRYDDVFVPFRQISFDKEIGGQLYRVSIRKSQIESNQLLKIITIVMLIVLCAGLSLLYVFQQATSKRLWQPFYDTLQKAKEFNVHHGNKLTLPELKVYEFNELNSALSKMTEKILSDYQSLREFTENASHEIQTPLALINTRVEGLIQDPTISANQVAWIQDIHESTLRLSKLNHALLLLAKIENGQFEEVELLNLNPVLEKYLNEMDELFSAKEIKVSFNQDGSFEVRMHPALADVLVSNLLNNAIKHNVPKGGTVSITSSEDMLNVTNTGFPLTIDPKKLFERFQKQNKSSPSLGLGLAMVKKICEISKLGLEYRYADGLHGITITRER